MNSPLVNPDTMGVLLSAALHVLRVKYRVSQRDVARFLDVQPQLLSDIKHGRKRMADRVAHTFEEFFQVRWRDIAVRIPNHCLDRDAVLAQHCDDPALADIRNDEERYHQAVQAEIARLDVRLFPEMRVPMAEAKSEGAIQLPILERPTVGNPLRAAGYSGFLFSVTEHAAYLTKQARDPYLLRFMGEDPTGRFAKGDLLLVDQDAHSSDAMIQIIAHQGEFWLARKVAAGYDTLFPRSGYTAEGEEVRCAGVVRAIVWAVV